MVITWCGVVIMCVVNIYLGISIASAKNIYMAIWIVILFFKCSIIALFTLLTQFTPHSLDLSI